MTKTNFKKLLAEARDEGANDTATADVLAENALSYLDQVNVTLTDNQRDELIEAYHQGFKEAI